MNVNQLIGKLFGRDSGPKPAKVPLVSESLERTKKEEWEYAEWLGTGRYRDLMPFILDGIKAKQENRVHNLNVHLHETSVANGFFFCHHSGFSNKCMSHMLEYFKDRILEGQPYYLNHKLREYAEEPDRVKTTESYYLKPSLKMQMESPVNQLFGNIHIEYVRFNDEPEYLKVMVTNYKDRNYTQALPYQDFLSFLFDVKS